MVLFIDYRENMSLFFPFSGPTHFQQNKKKNNHNDVNLSVNTIQTNDLKGAIPIHFNNIYWPFLLPPNNTYNNENQINYDVDTINKIMNTYPKFNKKNQFLLESIQDIKNHLK